MAIKVNGTTVIDDNRNLVNITSGLGGSPAGSIIYHAANTPPTGFIKANGASLSTSTYADLFAAIGYTYGGSGGSFNVPDLRGEFLRGWDDGRGVDSGRGFGSAQGDAIRNITGSVNGNYGPGIGVNQFASGSGAFSTSGNSGRTNNAAVGNSSGNLTLNLNAANQVPTASENRPRNRALLACIKY